MTWESKLIDVDALLILGAVVSRGNALKSFSKGSSVSSLKTVL